MRGAAGAVAGYLVAMAAMTTGFVIPGPSKVVSGRATRESTSQVIVMGRGDKRTEKGKRKRHSFGNSRPQGKKKAADVYFEGELVTKQAPVASRWDEVEYDSSLYASVSEGVAGEDEGASAVSVSPLSGGESVDVAAPAEVEQAVEEEAVAVEPEVESAEPVVEESSEEP